MGLAVMSCAAAFVAEPNRNVSLTEITWQAFPGTSSTVRARPRAASLARSLGATSRVRSCSTHAVCKVAYVCCQPQRRHNCKYIVAFVLDIKASPSALGRVSALWQRPLRVNQDRKCDQLSFQPPGNTSATNVRTVLVVRGKA